MKIILGGGSRIPIEGRFAQVPELLYAADLPPRAIVLWALLYGHGYRNQGVTQPQEISSEQMAEELHCSRAAVHDATVALIDAGWVVKVAVGVGRGSTSVYRVNLLPEPPEESAAPPALLESAAPLTESAAGLTESAALAAPTVLYTEKRSKRGAN